MQEFCRMQMLVGEQALQKLNNSHVAVFGIGGVGCHTVEALARAGVGKITLVDDDVLHQATSTANCTRCNLPLGNARWMWHVIALPISTPIAK